MTNVFDRIAGIPTLFGTAQTTQTKTGLALGSVYAYASTGAALGIRFIAPVTENLTDVWFFVTAIGGTPGVTTCELRGWNATTGTKPGTSALATQTITPGTAANKWINVHFSTPYSVTIGTPYWVVLGDAGWTSGNTATVDDISIIRNAFSSGGLLAPYTTTDGFATAGTLVANATPAMVLKFADNSLFGNPYTVSAAYTSNTLERGIKILGFTEDIIVQGMAWNNVSANISGLKIYKGTTAPGGTAEATITFPTGSGNMGQAYFNPFTFRKNSIYRVVFTFGSSVTVPSYYQIEDYTASADVTNAGIGGGRMYSTIDNGAGGWTDEIDKFPQMALLINDQYSIQHPSSPFKGVFG